VTKEEPKFKFNEEEPTFKFTEEELRFKLHRRSAFASMAPTT